MNKEKCMRCDSDNLAEVTAKCSDCCSYTSKTIDTHGDYVPYYLGIGGGDYIDFDYCLDCGQIQDDFPKFVD